MKPDELLEHEDERTVSLALARLRDAYADEQASPVTEERLLNELRRAAHEAAGKRAGLALGARQGSAWRRAVPFALAALLLVACGFVIWLVLYSESATPTQLTPAADLKRVKDVPKTEVAPKAVANEANRASTQQKTASQLTTTASGSRDRRAARRPGTTKALARTGRDAPRLSAGGTSELPAQESVFIPTMVPVGRESDYGLHLVRMELPRKTMMSFGLPVDPRQLSRPVKADLIIGPDGLTRAIRFVAQ
ncbi:MAG: hypothetical protein EHM61_22180 [Acidobacteria bacterium]|nr:MAG: hypothetical protein EHM61_28875 [Acidobacteriota bacterium]RPI22481.1 MAG: hypothetical protein EHM61_22180 [Acidobacteriota bacterium]